MYPGPYKITVTKEGFQRQPRRRPRSPLASPRTDPGLQDEDQGGGRSGGREAAAEALKAAFKRRPRLSPRPASSTRPRPPTRTCSRRRRRSPRSTTTWATSTAQKKDWPNAEAAYKKALELRPDYSDALPPLAADVPGQRPERQGHGALAKAARDSRATPRSSSTSASCQLNAGKSEEAIAAFKKADDRRSRRTPTRTYHLGTLVRRPEQDPRSGREPREVPVDEPDERARTSRPPRGCCRRCKPKK